MQYNRDTQQVYMTIPEIADILRGTPTIQDLLKIMKNNPEGSIKLVGNLKLTLNIESKESIPPIEATISIEDAAEIAITILESIKQAAFTIGPTT